MSTDSILKRLYVDSLLSISQCVYIFFKEIKLFYPIPLPHHKIFDSLKNVLYLFLLSWRLPFLSWLSQRTSSSKKCAAYAEAIMSIMS